MKTIGYFCNSRNNNYDFLRFLAAVMVIFSHSFALSYGNGEKEWCSLITREQLTFGRIAVIVFFIISGFLIAQSFERSRSLIKYAKARVLRIMPALAGVIFFTVFIGLITTTLPLPEYLTNKDMYKYLKNISVILSTDKLPGVFDGNIYPSAVNGSLWTLKFEVMCYVIIGILGGLKILKKPVLLILFALTYMVFVTNSWGILFSSDMYRLSYLSLFFFAGTLFYLFRDPA